MTVKFKTFINRIIRNFPKAIEKALEKIGNVAYISVKNTKRFKGRDGGLKTATKFIPNGSYAAEILSDKHYAFWVQEGNNQNGEYIYPVRAKALHFIVNGQEVFAKKVKAHGPIPYFTDARDEVEIQAQSIMETALNMLIKNSAK